MGDMKRLIASEEQPVTLKREWVTESFASCLLV